MKLLIHSHVSKAILDTTLVTKGTIIWSCMIKMTQTIITYPLETVTCRPLGSHTVPPEASPCSLPYTHQEYTDHNTGEAQHHYILHEVSASWSPALQCWVIILRLIIMVFMKINMITCKGEQKRKQEIEEEIYREWERQTDNTDTQGKR